MRQYIYGKNTVLESLKGEKPVYEIYMMKNAKDEKLLSLAKAKNAKVNIVAHKGVLNQLVGNVTRSSPSVVLLEIAITVSSLHISSFN